MFISQTPFTRSLLQKFDFTDCKPVGTPVDVSQKLQNVKEESVLLLGPNRGKIMVKVVKNKRLGIVNLSAIYSLLD